MFLYAAALGLVTYAAGNWLMAGDDMGPQGSGHAHAVPSHRLIHRQLLRHNLQMHHRQSNRQQVRRSFRCRQPL